MAHTAYLTFFFVRCFFGKCKKNIWADHFVFEKIMALLMMLYKGSRGNAWYRFKGSRVSHLPIGTWQHFVRPLDFICERSEISPLSALDRCCLAVVKVCSSSKGSYYQLPPAGKESIRSCRYLPNFLVLLSLTLPPLIALVINLAKTRLPGRCFLSTLNLVSKRWMYRRDSLCKRFSPCAMSSINCAHALLK